MKNDQSETYDEFSEKRDEPIRSYRALDDVVCQDAIQCEHWEYRVTSSANEVLALHTAAASLCPALPAHHGSSVDRGLVCKHELVRICDDVANVVHVCGS